MTFPEPQEGQTWINLRDGRRIKILFVGISRMDVQGLDSGRCYSMAIATLLKDWRLCE